MPRSDDAELARSNIKKAQKAAAARWSWMRELVDDEELHFDHAFCDDKDLKQNDYVNRRYAIDYVFRVLLGAPEEAKWNELDVVWEIWFRCLG